MLTKQGTMSDGGAVHQRHHSRPWNVKRRTKVARDCCFLGDSALSETRGQKLMSTPPLMQFMKYMVPSVLVLVTLRYQGKPEILFWKNPAPVWCFVGATSVYWLIVGAMKQMATSNGKCFPKFSHAALASGILSAFSLVSIFIPYPFSLVPLIIWIPLAVILACPKAFNLFHRGIIGVNNIVQTVVVWNRGVDSMEQGSNLPV